MRIMSVGAWRKMQRLASYSRPSSGLIKETHSIESDSSLLVILQKKKETFVLKKATQRIPKSKELADRICT